ncbi:MAG: tetratricopeptide repeat protein, partial [Planctomycetaceae bacterium]|nr:tetratricopeptide repeat protein [Planctomycetaceae bacterium]
MRIQSYSFTAFFAVSFAASFLIFVSAVNADRIYMKEGKGRTVNGKILGINSEKVTVDVSGKKQEIAANIIRSIEFDGEPSSLKTARSNVEDSKMGEALEALSKIDVKTLSPDMKSDYDYFTAAAKAGLFLSGGGSADDAGKVLSDFIKNQKNSYHFFEVCEVYGDVMVAQEKFELAKKSYEVLAKAPWPEYSLKAKVSLGWAEVAEGKIDDARKNFESVIGSDNKEEEIERVKNIAKIGLTLCLAGEKKYEEAAKELERIGRESIAEDSEFQAMIFNALGSTYEKSGKTKEAILAYLHTDILFSSARSEHIKALQSLSRL